MKTFEEVRRTLRTRPGVVTGKGVSEAAIRAAEKSLGNVIRGGYRLFLLEFGWGGSGDEVLFGLGKGVPRHLELVATASRERTEMVPRLRSDLVPLMNDGAGNLFCIDGSHRAPAEPTIVLWDHEFDEDQVPYEYGTDFCSWFLERLA